MLSTVVDKVSATVAVNVGDVIVSMMETELRGKRFTPTAFFVRKRMDIVDYMFALGSTFKVDLKTCIVALNYVDRCLQRTLVEERDYQKVACVCLSLACKYEEREDTSPHFYSYISHPLIPFRKRREMLNYELFVINVLQWDMGLSTVSHYVDIYLEYPVVTRDVHSHIDSLDTLRISSASRFVNPLEIATSPTSVTKSTGGETCSKDKDTHTMSLFNSLCQFIMECSQMCYEIERYRPSLQAAATIACARSILGIQSIWNRDLYNLTLYTSEDIAGCMKVMLAQFRSVYEDNVFSEDDDLLSPDTVVFM